MVNKKGLSTVIATVLIILLVVTSVAIVWAFVKNFIESRQKITESCFDLESSDKVALNSYYTCYNASSGEVQFSISIGDTEIDSLVISILAGGSSKSFTLNNSLTSYSNIRPYKGIYGETVKLPGKNEGLTYVVSGFSGAGKVDNIKIAPVVGDDQCSSTDEILQVESCVFLGN